MTGWKTDWKRMRNMSAGQGIRRRGLILLFVLQAHIPVIAMAEKDLALAIIPGAGDRTPPAAAVSVLEVALSHRKGTILLERERIQKVLSEQQLAAAGLTTPQTAVKLGRLLKADVFVINPEHTS